MGRTPNVLSKNETRWRSCLVTWRGSDFSQVETTCGRQVVIGSYDYPRRVILHYFGGILLFYLSICEWLHMVLDLQVPAPNVQSFFV